MLGLRRTLPVLLVRVFLCEAGIGRVPAAGRSSIAANVDSSRAECEARIASSSRSKSSSANSKPGYNRGSMGYTRRISNRPNWAGSEMRHCSTSRQTTAERNDRGAVNGARQWHSGSAKKGMRGAFGMEKAQRVSRVTCLVPWHSQIRYPGNVQSSRRERS